MRLIILTFAFFGLMPSIVYAQSDNSSFTLDFDVPSHGWAREAYEAGEAGVIDPQYILGGPSTTHLRFDVTGNLVLYDADSNILWESFTDLASRRTQSSKADSELVGCFATSPWKDVEDLEDAKLATLHSVCRRAERVMLTNRGLSILDDQARVVWETDLAVAGVLGDITLKIKDDALVLEDVEKGRDIWSSDSGFIPESGRVLRALHSTYATTAFARHVSTLWAGDRLQGATNYRGGASEERSSADWLELHMHPNGNLKINHLNRLRGHTSETELWSSGTAIAGVTQSDPDWGTTSMHVTHTGLELRRNGDVVWQRGHALEGTGAKHLNFTLSFRRYVSADVTSAVDSLVLMNMEHRIVTYQVSAQGDSRNMTEVNGSINSSCTDDRYDSGWWLRNLFLEMGLTMANDIAIGKMCRLLDKFAGEPMFYKLATMELHHNASLSEYAISAVEDAQDEIHQLVGGLVELLFLTTDRLADKALEHDSPHLFHISLGNVADKLRRTFENDRVKHAIQEVVELELDSVLLGVLVVTETVKMYQHLLDVDAMKDYFFDHSPLDDTKPQAKVLDEFVEPLDLVLDVAENIEATRESGEDNDNGSGADDRLRLAQADDVQVRCNAVCAYQTAHPNWRTDVNFELNLGIHLKEGLNVELPGLKFTQGVRFFFRFAFTMPEIRYGQKNAAIRLRVINPVNFLEVEVLDRADLTFFGAEMSELVFAFQWPSNLRPTTLNTTWFPVRVTRAYGVWTELDVRLQKLAQDLGNYIKAGYASSSGIELPELGSDGSELGSDVPELDFIEGRRSLGGKAKSTLTSASCDSKCIKSSPVFGFATKLLGGLEGLEAYFKNKTFETFAVAQELVRFFEPKSELGRSIIYNVTDEAGTIAHFVAQARFDDTGVDPTYQSVADDLDNTKISDVIKIYPADDAVVLHSGLSYLNVGIVTLEGQISELTACEQKVYIDNFDDNESITGFLQRVEWEMNPSNGICGKNGSLADDGNDGNLRRAVVGPKGVDYSDDTHHIEKNTVPFVSSTIGTLLAAVVVSVANEVGGVEVGAGIGWYFSYEIGAMTPLKQVILTVGNLGVAGAGAAAVIMNLEFDVEGIDPVVLINSGAIFGSFIFDMMASLLFAADCAQQGPDGDCLTNGPVTTKPFWAFYYSGKSAVPGTISTAEDHAERIPEPGLGLLSRLAGTAFDTKWSLRWLMLYVHSFDKDGPDNVLSKAYAPHPT